MKEFQFVMSKKKWWSMGTLLPRSNSSGAGGGGGAIVLGKLPGPGRPTIWMTVGQGPTAFAVGEGGGCLDFFLFFSIFSLLFLRLSGRRPDID